MNNLDVVCTAFKNNGEMPKKHTGRGEDVSTGFRLENIPENTMTVAVIMDDLDVPMTKEFCHWLLWNIPKTDVIPENVPHGATVESLGGAVQGTAYGVNRYSGPKIPFFMRKPHRYIFRFYALDCLVDLDGSAKKPALLKAMQGHILAQGEITGISRNE